MRTEEACRLMLLPRVAGVGRDGETSSKRGQMEAKPYAILGGWGVQESADPQRQRPLHLQVMQVTLSFLSSTTFALHNVKPAAGFMKCRPAWAYPTSTQQMR